MHQEKLDYLGSGQKRLFSQVNLASTAERVWILIKDGHNPLLEQPENVLFKTPQLCRNTGHTKLGPSSNLSCHTGETLLAAQYFVRRCWEMCSGLQSGQASEDTLLTFLHNRWGSSHFSSAEQPVHGNSSQITQRASRQPHPSGSSGNK